MQVVALHALSMANRSDLSADTASSSGDGTGESRIGESVWRGGNSAIDRASGPGPPCEELRRAEAGVRYCRAARAARSRPWSRSSQRRLTQP